MNKREYCESRKSIAYYSGLNGLEIKGIEYGIDGGIVSDMRIDADSVENALEIYRERVEEKHCIIISKNAIKNKSEMFVDLSDGGCKTSWLCYHG